MNTPQTEDITVDLKHPGVAAVLAWLIPGAGHFYQQRYAKGVLFMICILGSYLFGLTLGNGHVVYASWTKTDKRWQYICQVGVGLPSIPALIQSRRQKAGKPLLWGGFMAPPEQPVDPDEFDELASWHEQLGSNFELGTLYTMVAGLLNVLVIFDAYAGPFVPAQDRSSTPKPPPEASSKRKRKHRGQ